MNTDLLGRILTGSVDVLHTARERFDAQPVDWDLTDHDVVFAPKKQTTIAKPVSVAGPGTFLSKETREMVLEPTELEGWWFVRDDLDDCLPVRVSIRNVWTTGDVVSNIVLRSGPPQNYMRMVEHIVALKCGLPIDNLMIRMKSGDPPLFNRGSLDLLEALESAGTREAEKPVRYFTVKEKVTVAAPNGSFVTFHPCESDSLKLTLDCAIDFKTAIGKQRIKFVLNPEQFKYGAEARTNTSYIKTLYCKTIGKLFANIRNLGYTKENVLIASRSKYINEPKLIHDGKSLEAVWHRATLDLLAAVALLEEGRFCGHIESYCAGHNLDCLAMRLLYKHEMLEEVTGS